MRVLDTVFLVALTLSALGSSALSGQANPENIGGSNFRVGVGPGWSILGTQPPKDPPNSSMKYVEEDRLWGLGAFVAFGSGINDHWDLAVELGAFTGVDDFDVRRTQLGLHGVALFRPSPEGQFFLKGGLGVGMVVLDTVGGGREGRGAGLGYVIGAGYDLPAWGETVITPYLEIPFVRRFRGGVPNVIRVGLSLGW